MAGWTPGRCGTCARCAAGTTARASHRAAPSRPEGPEVGPPWGEGPGSPQPPGKRASPEPRCPLPRPQSGSFMALRARGRASLGAKGPAPHSLQENLPAQRPGARCLGHRAAPSWPEGPEVGSPWGEGPGYPQPPGKHASPEPRCPLPRWRGCVLTLSSALPAGLSLPRRLRSVMRWPITHGCSRRL